MRIFLLVIIIICLNSVCAEAQPVDSVLNEKLSVLQDSLNNLSQKYSFLEREFEKVNYQQTYFDSLISTHTTYLITVILIASAVFSWKNTKQKKELKALIKNGQKSEDSLNKLKQNLNKIEDENKILAYRMNIIISNYFVEKNSFKEGFLYIIYAIEYLDFPINLKIKQNIELIESLLYNLSDYLEKFDPDFESNGETDSKIKQALSKIIKLDDRLLSRLSTNILNKYYSKNNNGFNLHTKK